MLNRVKGVHKLYESSSFCEESLHTKFYTPSTFPSCVLICGGWVTGLHKTGIRGIQDIRQIVDGKTNDKENSDKKRWVQIS